MTRTHRSSNVRELENILEYAFAAREALTQAEAKITQARWASAMPLEPPHDEKEHATQ